MRIKQLSLGDWLSAGLFGFSAIFALNLIWNHLNVIQIDLGGHLASGSWFQRGYYHQFQDANFLGYVHGLFYPPLEDFLLAGLSWLCGNSPETGYSVYLSLLFVGYLGSIYFLGAVFQKSVARNAVRLLLLALVWLRKEDSLLFQGLSLQDLLVTGLSTQFLGAIFLFLLLREWIDKCRPR
ncbi:MAG: hypothetical protein KGQ59_07140, partial [Bdellovibrionales bacterium]|nr:hypothetical protein [Bdellovibrionales bacterium]